jgi:ribulose 1,5-bisphosphate synthetase/thiazole synthase
MKNILLLLSLFITGIFSPNAYSQTYDIIIYGGTSAGVAAAIQASRMDKSVILIESSNRIGGLTTGGLG